MAVIAFVFIPYIGRPLRGQVLALRNREFVEAATAQGAGPLRIMFSELLPNIASSVLVLFTLIVANAILTEVALSYLGAGVQPPQPSWGTMIADGQLTHRERPVAGHPAGDHDHHLGDLAQRLRRRLARRARPAREGEDRALRSSRR